jgi:hypothetical protein
LSPRIIGTEFFGTDFFFFSAVRTDEKPNAAEKILLEVLK